MNTPIYSQTSSFVTPIIEDDEITSDYSYEINYDQTKVKTHNKNNATPEHKYIFPNSCSLMMYPDLPHNVVNKLDDYTLDYGPLVYETSGSTFKESYILPSRPPWNEIDYIVSASYGSFGRISLISQSNGDVEVFGDNDLIGTIQDSYCTINVPFLVDASGSRINATLEMTTKKITGNDTPIFRYSVDSIWLDNAVYPVIIDPTVVIYSTSNVIAMYQGWNNSIARASNGNLIVAYGERTTWRIRVLIANINDFSNPTGVDVTTGTTFLDYVNLIRADDGRIVCIYRNRNGGDNVRSKYSLDNGLTWSSEASIANSYGANGLKAIKDQDGNLWAVTEDGNCDLFKSTDHGASWSNVGTIASQWYGDICENKKDRKIVCTANLTTNGNCRIRVWDIDSGTWDAAAENLPTTGYPSALRALSAGIDCDLQGNVIINLRIQYSSDSIYRLWEHKWISGSALSTATGSVVSIDGSEICYGDVSTDRSGIFHKTMWLQNGLTYYTSKGTFRAPNSYIFQFSGSNRLDYVKTYIDPWSKDSISEFNAFMLDYDSGGPTYTLSYNNDIVKKVGSFVMGSIG
jgi:hypothetical protein